MTETIQRMALVQEMEEELRGLEEWWEGRSGDEGEGFATGEDPLLALADEAAGMPTPANSSSQKVTPFPVLS